MSDMLPTYLGGGNFNAFVGDTYVCCFTPYLLLLLLLLVTIGFYFDYFLDNANYNIKSSWKIIVDVKKWFPIILVRPKSYTKIEWNNKKPHITMNGN